MPLVNGLLALPGVASIHVLHVWALTSGKNSLRVHMVLSNGSEEQTVLAIASAFRHSSHHHLSRSEEM